MEASLTGTTSATRADFQQVLNALQLQTVYSGRVSYRTILVQPDVLVPVARASYYLRDVKVGASPPNPILEVDFGKSQTTSQRPLILTEDQIFLNDPDTRDPTDDTKVDASRIKFRITGLKGGILQRRSASDV